MNAQLDRRTVRLHTVQRLADWDEVYRQAGRRYARHQYGPVLELEVGYRAAKVLLGRTPAAWASWGETR